MWEYDLSKKYVEVIQVQNSSENCEVSKHVNVEGETAVEGQIQTDE